MTPQKGVVIATDHMEWSNLVFIRYLKSLVTLMSLMTLMTLKIEKKYE